MAQLHRENRPADFGAPIGRAIVFNKECWRLGYYMSDIGAVLDHEGPPPHPAGDQAV
jgi:hypothetical protein